MQIYDWCRSYRVFCCTGLIWLVVFHSALGVGEIISTPTNSPTVFNVEAATRAYLDQLTPAQKSRSNSYFEGGYWLQLWGYIWSAGIALLLLQTRLSARMRDLAVRLTRFKFLQTAIYALLYIPLVGVLTFPLTLYADFFREHQYGMATQGFGGWFLDQLIGLLVSMIFGCMLIVILMGIVRRLRNSWHIWGAIVAVVFLVLSIVFGPVFIAPLFNKYTLLSDPQGIKSHLAVGPCQRDHDGQSI